MAVTPPAKLVAPMVTQLVSPTRTGIDDDDRESVVDEVLIGGSEASTVMRMAPTLPEARSRWRSRSTWSSWTGGPMHDLVAFGPGGGG